MQHYAMIWQAFHHPDISWPVVRRRAGIEFMELVELAALFLCKGGWGLLNRSVYPSDAAYRSAVSRLGKQGLVVKQKPSAATPRLLLTDVGKGQLPPYFAPERCWNRSWNKVWYMLIYDVPETDRKYRNVLRQFLKRKRMGCLQKSVWVTPEDIRPDFADLSSAAAIDAFAFLFESQTVLGLPTGRIVEEAWDFERLGILQQHYCSVMQKNLALLSSQNHRVDDLAKLLRLSVDAYHAAMLEDPLLPHALLPDNYLGRKVFALHRNLISQIDRQAVLLHPN